MDQEGAASCAFPITGGVLAMNIAICEDDAVDMDSIRKILDGYMEQNGYAGEISAFESGEELLASFSCGLYDVVFLDIYMDGINGIETAKRIRDIDLGCVIVFITTSPDHSLESYSVRGAAYVVKPIRKEDMQKALLQCREVFMRNARYVSIRSDRMDIKLPLVKIYYVESYGKNAIFHTTDGEYTTRLTLDETERQLGGRPFYRCHQSYIINTNFISKISGNDVLMKNGDAAPMRKNGRDSIRADLADMLSSRMFETWFPWLVISAQKRKIFIGKDTPGKEGTFYGMAL